MDVHLIVFSVWPIFSSNQKAVYFEHLNVNFMKTANIPVYMK